MEAALSGPPRLGSIKVGCPRGLVVERVGCPAIPQSQKEELPGTTSFLKSLGSCLVSCHPSLPGFIFGWRALGRDLHCPAPSLFFYNLTLLLGDLGCIGRALEGSGPGLSLVVQLQPSVPLA